MKGAKEMRGKDTKKIRQWCRKYKKGGEKEKNTGQHNTGNGEARPTVT